MKPWRPEAKAKLNSDEIFLLDHPTPQDQGFRAVLMPLSAKQRETFQALAQDPCAQKVLAAITKLEQALQTLTEQNNERQAHKERYQVKILQALEQQGTPLDLEQNGDLYQTLRLLEINAQVATQATSAVAATFLQTCAAYLELYPLCFFLQRMGVSAQDFSPEQLTDPVFSGLDDSHKGRLELFATVICDFEGFTKASLELVELIDALLPNPNADTLSGLALFGVEPSKDAISSLKSQQPNETITSLISELSARYSNQDAPALIKFNELVQSPSFTRLKAQAAKMQDDLDLMDVGAPNKGPLYQAKKELTLTVAAAALSALDPAAQPTKPEPSSTTTSSLTLSGSNPFAAASSSGLELTPAAIGKESAEQVTAPAPQASGLAIRPAASGLQLSSATGSGLDLSPADSAKDNGLALTPASATDKTVEPQKAEAAEAAQTKAPAPQGSTQPKASNGLAVQPASGGLQLSSAAESGLDLAPADGTASETAASEAQEAASASKAPTKSETSGDLSVQPASGGLQLSSAAESGLDLALADAADNAKDSGLALTSAIVTDKAVKPQKAETAEAAQAQTTAPTPQDATQSKAAGGLSVQSAADGLQLSSAAESGLDLAPADGSASGTVASAPEAQKAASVSKSPNQSKTSGGLAIQPATGGLQLSSAADGLAPSPADSTASVAAQTESQPTTAPADSQPAAESEVADAAADASQAKSAPETGAKAGRGRKDEKRGRKEDKRADKREDKRSNKERKAKAASTKAASAKVASKRGGPEVVVEVKGGGRQVSSADDEHVWRSSDIGTRLIQEAAPERWVADTIRSRYGTSSAHARFNDRVKIFSRKSDNTTTERTIADIEQEQKQRLEAELNSPSFQAALASKAAQLAAQQAEATALAADKPVESTPRPAAPAPEPEVKKPKSEPVRPIKFVAPELKVMTITEAAAHAPSETVASTPSASAPELVEPSVSAAADSALELKTQPTLSSGPLDVALTSAFTAPWGNFLGTNEPSSAAPQASGAVNTLALWQSTVNAVKTRQASSVAQNSQLAQALSQNAAAPASRSAAAPAKKPNTSAASAAQTASKAAAVSAAQPAAQPAAATSDKDAVPAKAESKAPPQADRPATTVAPANGAGASALEPEIAQALGPDSLTAATTSAPTTSDSDATARAATSSPGIDTDAPKLFDFVSSSAPSNPAELAPELQEVTAAASAAWEQSADEAVNAAARANTTTVEALGAADNDTLSLTPVDDATADADTTEDKAPVAESHTVAPAVESKVVAETAAEDKAPWAESSSATTATSGAASAAEPKTTQAESTEPRSPHQTKAGAAGTKTTRAQAKSAASSAESAAASEGSTHRTTKAKSERAASSGSKQRRDELSDIEQKLSSGGDAGTLNTQERAQINAAAAAALFGGGAGAEPEDETAAVPEITVDDEQEMAERVKRARELRSKGARERMVLKNLRVVLRTHKRPVTDVPTEKEFDAASPEQQAEIMANVRALLGSLQQELGTKSKRPAQLLAELDALAGGKAAVPLTEDEDTAPDEHPEAAADGHASEAAGALVAAGTDLAPREVSYNPQMAQAYEALAQTDYQPLDLNHEHFAQLTPEFKDKAEVELDELTPKTRKLFEAQQDMQAKAKLRHIAREINTGYFKQQAQAAQRANGRAFAQGAVTTSYEAAGTSSDSELSAEERAQRQVQERRRFVRTGYTERNNVSVHHLKATEVQATNLSAPEQRLALQSSGEPVTSARRSTIIPPYRAEEEDDVLSWAEELASTPNEVAATDEPADLDQVLMRRPELLALKYHLLYGAYFHLSTEDYLKLLAAPGPQLTASGLSESEQAAKVRADRHLSSLIAALRPFRELNVMRRVLLELSDQQADEQRWLRLQRGKLNYYLRLMGRNFYLTANAQRAKGELDPELERLTNLSAQRYDDEVKFVLATILLTGANLYLKAQLSPLSDTYQALNFAAPC